MKRTAFQEASMESFIETDVVVVGGGPAGFASAIRAVEGGVNALVIERLSTLGGMATSGLMSVSVGESLGELQTELFERLRKGGHITDPLERHPGLASNALFHYYGPNVMPGRKTPSKINAFDPIMTAILMNEMFEERGVRFLLGTLLVDALVEENTLRAIIVQGASGRQAIAGKVFLDATGNGDLVARCGAPYKNAGDKHGVPIAPGLMWKMCNVDYENLFEFQKMDPHLNEPMRRAEAEGAVPYYRPKKMDIYGGAYSGHPRPEMCPTPYPGEMLLWSPAPHEWRLNCAESSEDWTRAEVELRKHIVAEATFLIRYVPGFEKAYLCGVASLLGIREGRRPEGEYVMRYEDIREERRFKDAALRRKTLDWFDAGRGNRLLSFDIPYRCFLARKVHNLLLVGDNLSMEHEALLHIRGFGMAMRTGEVGGKAAADSLNHGISPKELKWDGPLEKTS